MLEITVGTAGHGQNATSDHFDALHNLTSSNNGHNGFDALLYYFLHSVWFPNLSLITHLLWPWCPDIFLPNENHLALPFPVLTLCPKFIHEFAEDGHKMTHLHKSRKRNPLKIVLQKSYHDSLILIDFG